MVDDRTLTFFGVRTMKSQSVSYWMNQLGKNSDIEPKDEELSYQKIAEYYLSRENNKAA